MEGDGELDEKEFVKIMKEASSRGLNRVCVWLSVRVRDTLQPRDLGAMRGFQGLVDCIKIKLHDRDDLV